MFVHGCRSTPPAEPLGKQHCGDIAKMTTVPNDRKTHGIHPVDKNTEGNTNTNNNENILDNNHGLDMTKDNNMMEELNRTQGAGERPSPSCKVRFPTHLQEHQAVSPMKHCQMRTKRKKAIPDHSSQSTRADRVDLLQPSQANPFMHRVGTRCPLWVPSLDERPVRASPADAGPWKGRAPALYQPQSIEGDQPMDTNQVRYVNRCTMNTSAANPWSATLLGHC